MYGGMVREKEVIAMCDKRSQYISMARRLGCTYKEDSKTARVDVSKGDNCEKQTIHRTPQQ